MQVMGATGGEVFGGNKSAVVGFLGFSKVDSSGSESLLILPCAHSFIHEITFKESTCHEWDVLVMNGCTIHIFIHAFILVLWMDECKIRSL
jgi:hypothetical protein